MIGFLQTGKHFNIDDEKVWELVLELGTFEKVGSHLYSQGIKNEKNGKPLSKHILSIRTWRWVLDNPEKSLEMLRKKEPDVSDVYWEQFLVSKAYSIFVALQHNRDHFEEWLKERGLSKYSGYKKTTNYFKRRN